MLQLLGTWTGTFQDPSWVLSITGLVTAVGTLVWGNRRHSSVDTRVNRVESQIDPVPPSTAASAEDSMSLREILASVSTDLTLLREENAKDHAVVRETIATNHRENQTAIRAVNEGILEVRDRLARAEVRIDHNEADIHQLEDAGRLQGA